MPGVNKVQVPTCRKKLLVEAEVELKEQALAVVVDVAEAVGTAVVDEEITKIASIGNHPWPYRMIGSRWKRLI
jgi:methyl coenzyme M reductase beta subunit